MSQPNREQNLAEAKERYLKEIETFKYKFPHTPLGECTSDCNKTVNCPLDEIPPFEEWIDTLN